jgi:aminopeptidase
MESIYTRYAQLLTQYCLNLQPGDRLLVQSTTLAEPLVREVYREGLRLGAQVLVELSFREQERIFYAEAGVDQLQYVSPLYDQAMREFEAYLYIRAPYNLRENHADDPEKSRLRQAATAPARRVYFERTGNGSMRRSLCQFPTLASAQEAGLSLEEYEQFVFTACRLLDPDPTAAWLEVRRSQQIVVDHLNACREIRYRNERTDIRFRTEGRRWINSDGQTNMPSGEVYTSPVEDSVEGVVHFDYPAIYRGREVRGVTLWVDNGEVQKWTAEQGQEVLDEVFALPGARYFGEAAIGTNYRIQQFTKNILFDEKIGGSIHMAVGQSYLQAGGKNESSVHWDMIADMRTGGEIWADGEKIYADGRFLLAGF